MEFITRFNRELGKDISVTLSLALAGSVNEAVVGLEFKTTDPKRVLYISKDFAEMLKFKRYQFPSGTFTGTDVVRQSDFNQFSFNSDLSMTLVDYKYQQSIVDVIAPAQAMFFLNKREGESYVSFFSRLSDKIGEVDFVVAFSFDASKRCTVKVDGNTWMSAKDHIVLSSNILTCLGFTQEKFELGEFTSELAFNEISFNSMPSSEGVFVRVEATTLVPIYMHEPRTNSIRDVIMELNKSFLSQLASDHYITFYYADGFIVLNENLSPKVTVKLPNLLCSYFGIPMNSMFKAGTKFPTLKEIVEEEEELGYEEKGEGHVTPIIINPKMLITSNVVKAQLYGDNIVPYLRDIVLSQNYKNSCVIEFNPVRYLPVCCEQLRNFVIEFLDENLQPIQLEGETSVTIEFRPRY